MDVLKLVVAVRVFQVVVGGQNDPELVALHLAVFEVRDVADDFGRELRLSGPKAERSPILQVPVRDGDRRHAARQQEQRQHAHELRDRDPQPDARHFPASNLLHLFESDE